MYRPTNGKPNLLNIPPVLLNPFLLLLTPAGAAYSYCLKWRGMYRPTNGKPASVVPGAVYGMRVLLEAPMAAADKTAGMQPRHVPVSRFAGPRSLVIRVVEIRV
jgi:hypothetical protein